jgi:hypothetical protein
MCSDLQCSIAIGSLAWMVAGLMCLFCLRRAVYNFTDPFVAVNVTIPFSAALLAVLCATRLVAPDKLLWFFLVLAGFLAGARTVLAFFGRERFRLAIVRAISGPSKLELQGLLILTALVTIVLTVFAVQAGAQGDARQDFGRTFRPLVTLQSGLFLFSLLALLSPKLSIKQVASWLVFLVILSIAFSGKAVFMPIFLWFGLRLFIQKRRVGVRTIVILAIGITVGIAIMGIVAYGVSSSGGVLSLIMNRLWLSGDVYIYAYQMDALSYIRGIYPVTFLSYVFHPITSLVGIRGYEKPLGSMIASQVTGSDVLTGPNPQLPVLLDFFFPNQIVLSMSIAFVIGAIVIGIRLIGVRLAEGRSRALALGGIAAAVFTPSAGFVDMSQSLIALVGITAVTVGGASLELLIRRPAQSDEPHQPNEVDRHNKKSSAFLISG